MKTKAPAIIIGAAVVLVLMAQWWTSAPVPPAPPPAVPSALYATNSSILVTAVPGQKQTFGFVVSSTDGTAVAHAQKFLIRAVGPGLKKLGITGTADDPSLFVNLPTPVTVDDWSADPANRAACEDAAARCGAFALDVGSKDAAVVVAVGAGSHAVAVTLPSGGGGALLIEVYRVP